jgi:hypothetical protein
MFDLVITAYFFAHVLFMNSFIYCYYNSLQKFEVRRTSSMIHEWACFLSIPVAATHARQRERKKAPGNLYDNKCENYGLWHLRIWR